MVAHAQINTETVKNFYTEHTKMQGNSHHKYTASRRGIAFYKIGLGPLIAILIFLNFLLI